MRTFRTSPVTSQEHDREVAHGVVLRMTRRISVGLRIRPILRKFVVCSR
jgi:hypothetical protein